MRPFQYLDQPTLLDLLAYVTARYTKMFSSDMINNDYIACRELLLLLQVELAERKKRNDNTSDNSHDLPLSPSIG